MTFVYVFRESLQKHDDALNWQEISWNSLEEDTEWSEMIPQTFVGPQDL